MIAEPELKEMKKAPSSAALQVTPPSLDIVFDLVKGQLGAQDDQIKALDGKANFSLASATLLTGGIANLWAALGEAEAAGTLGSKLILGLTINPVTAVRVLAILATLAYMGVVISAYNAYKLRSYLYTPKPEEFIAKYMLKPQEVTKEWVAGTWVDTHTKNAALIEKKIRWIKAVLALLMLEAALLLAMTLVQLLF